MRAFVAVAALILMLSAVVTYPPEVNAAAAPISVNVCGEATDEAKAMEDARFKAAKKTLAKIMAPRREANSLFQKIARDYASYTGKIDVKQKQESNGKIQLICAVAVDQQKLLEIVNQMTDARDGAIVDSAGGNTAFFFVRVKGAADDTLAKKYEQKLLTVCNDRFQRMGFMTDVEDEIFVTLNRYKSMPYDAFCRQMTQKIRQDYPEIVVAVIGEVTLSPIGNDDTGYTVNGDILLTALDVPRNNIVINLNEAYRAKGDTTVDANDKILAKIAVNTAETLTDKILSKR